MSPLLAAGVGILIGLVVGSLGAGGGILTLPVLVYVLGMEPHSAAAASLVVVGATSVVALLPHARRGNVQWLHGLTFGLLGTAGAVGGARLAELVAPEVLMALLAGLLLLVAVVMVHRSVRRSGAGRPVGAPRPRGTGRLVLTVATASLIGLLTGFFGVGGGFVVVPALLLVMRASMQQAVGTSLLVIVLNTATGLLGRVGQSFEIDWLVIGAFTVASMLGGVLGARFSGRATPRTLALLFALLLTGVAVATGLQAVPALVDR